MPEFKYDYVANSYEWLREYGISEAGRAQIVRHQPLTDPKDRDGLHRFLSDKLGNRGELQIAFPVEGGTAYGPRWDFFLMNALLNRGFSLLAAQQVWLNKQVTDPVERKRLRELMNWLLDHSGSFRGVKHGRKGRLLKPTGLDRKLTERAHLILQTR